MERRLGERKEAATVIELDLDAAAAFDYLGQRRATWWVDGWIWRREDGLGVGDAVLSRLSVVYGHGRPLEMPERERRAVLERAVLGTLGIQTFQLLRDLLTASATLLAFRGRRWPFP